jgi:hypothetical protein
MLLECALQALTQCLRPRLPRTKAMPDEQGSLLCMALKTLVVLEMLLKTSRLLRRRMSCQDRPRWVLDLRAQANRRDLD